MGLLLWCLSAMAVNLWCWAHFDNAAISLATAIVMGVGVLVGFLNVVAEAREWRFVGGDAYPWTDVDSIRTEIQG